MSLRVKLGDNGAKRPTYEDDEAADKLAAELANVRENPAADIPLQPQPAVKQPAPAPPPKPAPGKPVVTGQQLLDALVVGVLEERIGIVEQEEKCFLTLLEQKGNAVVIRTIGQLWLGGVTVVKGSTVTK